MKIKDNELLRQFESTINDGMLIMEYAIQERKLFLTKLHHPAHTSDDEINIFISAFEFF
jgi:hypothetical protein